MIPRKIALLVVIAATIAAIVCLPTAMCLGTSRGRPAQAATTEGSAPGQLTLVNRKGESIGLCPLKHTDVTADIAGYVARVTVKQEFTNLSKEPVEALYSFPLPNDAAVDEMTMTIGTRVVRGQIKRKEEAQAIYEAARANGQAAALLDQERPNTFTQQVANVLPGAKVVITIGYVNLLKYQEGQYEFVFPMVVGPRYVPGTGYVTAAPRGAPSATAKVEIEPGTAPVVLDGHRITPPITPRGTRAGHDISLTVHLDAGIPLQSLAAVQHKVSVVPHGRSAAIVTLENREEIPNKDFILRFTAAGSEMVEGLLAYAPMRAGIAGSQNPLAPVSGYFTMIVQPPLAPPKEQISPKEMVFVIDQTGSQSGWPLEKAKETMKYCIANMNAGDTFQLIGFNTALFPCFPAPVSNSLENVAKALKFLEPLAGNGGTDILKSVDYALSLPDDPDRLRIVCYMTDGYVGNDMQIIDYIRKHRGRARMFPFGIGNSVNRFLIDGMAREGRGAAEYVAVSSNGGAQYGGQMPEAGVKGAKEAAERFYRRIASPLLLDVSVDWNGLPVEDVYPKQIPDVFSSGPIVLKGRYTRAAEGDITIHGMLRGKPWARTLHVSLPAAHSDGSAISTLWAREKIEDLQNQDWLGAQSNSPHPEIQQQIINTALEYHLMSQYTSFVAVEQRVVNIGGRQRTLDVPVEMPEGVAYDGIMAEGKTSKPDHWSYRRSGGFSAGGLSGGSSFGSSASQRGASAHLYSLAQITPAVKARIGSNVRKDGESAALGLQVDRAAQRPAAPKPLSASASLSESLGRKGKEYKSLQAGKSIALSDSIQQQTGNGFIALRKQPAATPEERRATLEQSKLAPALMAKLAAFRKAKGAKPEVVEVQVWVNALPPDGLAKLNSLGFNVAATLTPRRLLFGTISLSKLDDLLKLPFVQLVEPPRFK